MIKSALVRIWTFALCSLVPTLSLANWDSTSGDTGHVCAPELDPSSAAAALALLVSAVLYLRRAQQRSH